MSHDFYLVCKEKKIYMPIFTMVMGSCSLSDKRWVFDFILKCGGSPIMLVDENNEDDMPEYDDESWEFINAWHKYEEIK